LAWAFLRWIWYSALPQLVRAINRALADLWRGALSVITAVRNFVLHLITNLHHFWSRSLVPLFRWLWRQYGRLQRFLDRVLGPVFDVIRRIRRVVERIYTTFVRPVLDAIQITRRVLEILERFGVEWAAKLDRALAELEAKVRGFYLEVLTRVNLIADTLDRIVTFDYLFQRVTLLGSLRRDLGWWTRMFWRDQVKGLTPEERQTLAGREIQPIDARALGQDLGELYRSGAGRLAPIVEELLPLWREAAGLR
jgi:hypothetical protein